MALHAGAHHGAPPSPPQVLLLFPHAFWEDLEGRRDFWGVCAPTSKRRGEGFQFWNLQRCTGQPMLLVLHAGRAACRDGAPTRDEDAVEATLEYLRGIFGADAVPAPTQQVVTRWDEDPYARGVYSHVALGATSRDYDLMAEPLWDDTLLWAGEATCRAHPATVAGAFISGLREAARFACRMHQEGRGRPPAPIAPLPPALHPHPKPAPTALLPPALYPHPKPATSAPLPPAFHSCRTPDQSELLAALQKAQNDASEARAEAQQAEARVAELLREARQAESVARRQAEMERAQQRSG